MASDASGVTDTRSALDRDIALLRAGETVLSPNVILSLDGVRMALPFEADQIGKIVDSAYRVGGFAALTMIHDAAVTSFESFQQGSANQAAEITGRVLDREELAKIAQDMIPESGDRSAAEALLAERRYARDLYKDAMPSALQQLEVDRARRTDQLADLREAIDRIAEVEEVAQRWYEGKLMASIAADFDKRQKDLQQAWRTYRIGDGQTKLAVFLQDTKSSDGLVILAEDDTGTIEVGKKSATIQGETEQVTVPAVIKATYQLARAQYDYKEAFRQATRAAALRGGSVDLRNMPAWQKREKYARLVRDWGEKHFIALAAHRGLIETTRDINTAFDRKRYETAIIDAFLKAHDTMPRLLREMQNNVLFQDDEPVAVTGVAAMARPAAEVLIAARYGQQADVVFVRPGENSGTAQAGHQPASDKSVPDIYRSPWEQKPFLDRLMQLANVLRIEEKQANAASLAPPAIVDPTSAAAASPEDNVDPKVLERMKREVMHLRPLFKEPADRQMLLWCTSIGTLMSRARSEVSERLEERIENLAEMRASAQLAIATAGVVLIPFTGGQSIIVAGAIDAMLVADRSSDDVQKWIAARQFSRVVLDELASMHWTEPETSMLVGQLLEAGYEIAGDLLQTGAAGKIFDMISVADLGLSLVDTSVEMLQRTRP